MPRKPLLRMTTLTGRLYWTAVASSCMFICMLPSPAISTTRDFGKATWAPMAAGNPYPIVPRPPDVRHVRGLRNLKNWAVHIWFCPTSVVMMALPFVSSNTLSMTYWGFTVSFF
ncbi:MAG: hypothetical protein A4E60_03223 [Syntrophorhabdus sp. PtaB.Bin047]|nr:MAG: hypothetical protein A4E60_03223 [Syntrophorhabdus sp. PtaB.Bin047]